MYRGVPSLYFQKVEVVDVWGSLAKMAGGMKGYNFVPQVKYGKIHTGKEKSL